MKTFAAHQITFLKEFVKYYNDHFNGKVLLVGDHYRGPSRFESILCPAFLGVDNLYLFLMEFGRALESNNMGDAFELTEHMFTHKKGHKITTIFLSNFKPF